ncbi:MAG: ATP-binding protein [Actinomycetota bacterium]|nr:ATP-binding protein [Actinomycetota bacterium]
MTSTPPATLLDSLPDAVLQLDLAHVVLAANATACRLTGYSPEHLIGKDCRTLLVARSRDGRQVWADGWHSSTRLRSVRTMPEQDITIRTASGRDVKTFVAGSYQRNDDGELTGIVLVLREAGRRAHQAATGIEIVSTVSHELRSPLTSVKGYTSLLLNRWGRLRDDQKQMMLEQVNHDADRVTRLVTELLDISRLETGRLVLRPQLVDLSRLAAMVVEKVKLEYPELDARISFADNFPKVFADPDKIEQVLTNLVENACKYASLKGLRLVGEVGPGDEVSVTVTDKGEGIPAADLHKVFTKFFRRSEGRPTGSGLGLWISRGLVEAHSGRLAAESNPGQGTSFRFTLPLIEPEELRRP